MPTSPAIPDVRLLALDVDGVLTDGGIYVDDDGRESKRFDVVDGFALRLWSKLGYASAIITGRGGGTVLHRAAYLGISHVATNVADKAAALIDLTKATGIEPANIAFLADDWPDLILRRVGYPMAVANARAEVKAVARHVTTAPGGRGAVREAIEHLLDKRGRLLEALALYDPQHGA
jgi:3-deoxy-D-manno-octulosonate 8-phosphate phosphatase (KDO 8-P phosphatase)